MSSHAHAFSDPDMVSRYTDEPPRRVPGYHAMHQMAAILLAENAPPDARVLVLGAGGGLELKTFAEANPGWSLDGVDPSAEMLKLAAKTLGPLTSRVRFTNGLIDDVSGGGFDAATSILTLHFLDAEERLRTATEVHRRLKPGAPFVVAHFSVPHDTAEEGERWLSRYVEFCVASGISRTDAETARSAIDDQVPILSPDQDREILRQAGFTDITEFYTAFTFRGWVAYA